MYMQSFKNLGALKKTQAAENKLKVGLKGDMKQVVRYVISCNKSECKVVCILLCNARINVI